MTVAKQSCAALPAGKEECVHAQQVELVRRRSGFAICVFLSLVVAAFGAMAGSACAETVRVRASADFGLPQVQARQQALERALSEAVFMEARHLLPVLVPQLRLDALRSHLSPHALDYVHAYQEVSAQKPAQDTSQAPAAPLSHETVATAPLELELDVRVNRTYLRQSLVRLGFFAGPRHTASYALRLGRGVKEKDAEAFGPLDLLLGLTREQASPAGAAPEVSLEYLPQGYYKAVLRQGPTAFAVDAPALPGLWLDVWGKYFEEVQRVAGPGVRRLVIAGFTGVDAALEFLQAMVAWDEAVQEPKLAILELNGTTVTAQFVCRVINQQAFDTRLVEALGSRKLSLAGQTGQTAP